MQRIRPLCDTLGVQPPAASFRFIAKRRAKSRDIRRQRADLLNCAQPSEPATHVIAPRAPAAREAARKRRRIDAIEERAAVLAGRIEDDAGKAECPRERREFRIRAVIRQQHRHHRRRQARELTRGSAQRPAPGVTPTFT